MLGVGDVLKETYRLERELGRGGMGRVFEASHTRIERRFAVKCLMPGRGEDALAIARLRREARITSALGHPHIVEVVDFDLDDEGAPYVVMELLEGVDLATRLAEGPPPDATEVSAIVRQIASALSAAHELGIVHRDLKPSNVFLCHHGGGAPRVKVIDFGISKMAAPEEPALTTEGSLVGTPLYMAPEHLRDGQEVDLRADVYALGAVVYEMLAGHPPFTGRSFAELVVAILDARPRPLATLRPDLPPTIAEVVHRALAPAPEGRFQTAAALARALEAGFEGAAQPSLPPVSPFAATSAEAAAPGSRLPLRLSSFVGRRAEVAEVRACLRAARLLTLTGPGGMGKTRLGLQALTRPGDGLPGDVRWAELAREREPEHVPVAIAAATGVRERGDQPLVATLREELRDRSMILGIDNCEHLLPAVREVVRALLDGCPGVRILATSRELLGLGGEAVYEVPPLALPAETAEGAREADAVRLFVDRARTLVPSFEICDEELADLLALCRRLEGMPLAIELAAARVRAMSVAQIAGRLGAAKLLDARGAMDDDRHRTLRAAIEWSYDLATERERELLRRISVFRGGFSLEAAEAVCAGDGLEEDDVAELLTGLVTKSLVKTTHAGADVRFGLVEAIRVFAEAARRESSPDGGWELRHAEHFAGGARSFHGDLVAGDQRRLLDAEVEHANFRAALEWLDASGRGAEGLELANHLYAFWWIAGHYREASRWLDAMLAATEGQRTPLRVEALGAASACHGIRGDAARADVLSRRALEEARAIGEPVVLGSALRERGGALLYAGDYEAAAALLEESFELLDGAGQPSAAVPLWNLVLCELWVGRSASALGRIQRLEALVGGGGMMGPALPALRARLELEGEVAVPTARARIEGTLAELEEAHNAMMSMLVGGFAAALAVFEGRPEDAVRTARRALEHANALGVPLAELVTRLNLARATLEAGDLDAASAEAWATVALAGPRGHGPHVAEALGCLAAVALEREGIEEALRLHVSAEAIWPAAARGLLRGARRRAAVEAIEARLGALDAAPGPLSRDALLARAAARPPS